MKLSSEIFKNIFCCAVRPKICLKNINLCCLECDQRRECKKINEDKGSKILPCVEDDEEVCPYLI